MLGPRSLEDLGGALVLRIDGTDLFAVARCVELTGREGGFSRNEQALEQLVEPALGCCFGQGLSATAAAARLDAIPRRGG